MNDFERILNKILERKVAFAMAFFVVFTISYGLLYAVDFLPEPVSKEAKERFEGSKLEEENLEETPAVSEEAKDYEVIASVDALPRVIKFDSLNREVTVLNPASRSIADLDEALLKGVVRHPDSATLKQDGNLFILGHSSYLPNVLNRNFQAFNGIQNLKWGDTIRVQSNDTEYVYRVEKVYQAKASAVTVPIAGVGKRLTLATCNSFGSNDDRYIVEASLISQSLL